MDPSSKLKYLPMYVAPKSRFFLIVLFLGISSLAAQSRQDTPKASRCHAFVDDRNIWTLEIVEDSRRNIVPILNIITFRQGEWEFRPPQIHIRNEKGRKARVEKFSLDTGVPDEPYLMEYFRVLGNSFIGLELMGQFRDFAEPAEVAIDLGEFRYQLQPIDCLDFDTLAQKIDQVNIDSPDISEDFYVLKIDFIGRKQPRTESDR